MCRPAAWTSGSDNTRAEIVAWIEDENGKAYVQDDHGNRVDVGVVTPAIGPKYLRTYADGIGTNNLLSSRGASTSISK